MASSGFVSLTYDGSLLCHLETVLPHLEETGLKATFYAEPAMLLENLPGWALAVIDGHEVGNGALHGAVLEDGSLPGWTPAMVADDVTEAKALIDELFPEQHAHSFGFPWGRPLSDGIDVSSTVQNVYPVVRSGEPGINDADQSSDYLLCVPCDGLSAAEMIDYAKAARQEGTWVVLSFEGVGVGERAVDASAHLELCEFLTSANIEVAPVVHAAKALATAKSHGIKLV